MSLAAAAISRRTVTTFATLVLVIAGIASYSSLGQLEDPEFTVKTATVITPYAGATAEEVELEVTDRLEIALQELTQVKELQSYSRAGLSLIKVIIEPAFKSPELPQVWDEVRKKVRDARPQLPPGVGQPVVGDDFGDVYGFFMAVVSDGFTYAELKEYVDAFKKELSLVEGVSRVELWGDQAECIYIDATQTRLVQLGISMNDIMQTLSQQNVVVNAGGLEIDDERLRFETTGEFGSPEDIGELVIRNSSVEDGESREITRIADIGTVRRGYVEPTNWKMRYDGRSAIGISISNRPGVNIVDVGRRIDAALEVLRGQTPVGIEFEPISWQSQQVADSISAFMISLMQAVAIVLVVLAIAMGIRTAIIVGICGLVFVIIASFLFMDLLGIDLQRMSLGALVIAMGMMVDNAIVVTDGIVVRIQRGMDRIKAAVEAASQPSIPLLGATVVAVMAFYPIAASDEGAGEYCATLFSVVAISLMLSWVLSVTITPLMCVALLPEPKADAGDPFGGPMFRLFRRILELAIRARWIVIVVFGSALVVSGMAFRHVDRMFFPASARPQIMVDYWAPEGTRIESTSDGVAVLEDYLGALPEVDAVSTFVGQGPSRFYLPVDPELPYQSYAQCIVNVHDYRTVDTLVEEIQDWTGSHVPEARVVVRKYGLGPSETWPVEARFSGPAVADSAVLRRLAAEAAQILAASPHAREVRTDWRDRVKKYVANYDEVNARWTGVAREDIADAVLRGFDGLPVGQYREQDKVMPILLRHVQPERVQLATAAPALRVLTPDDDGQGVPLAQVTSSLKMEWEDPLIWRWDRRRAITVQGVPVSLATTLFADVRADIEAIELPPGYRLMWDGEYRSSTEAQQSLIPGMIPAIVIIAVIVVGLFNAYRPPLVILCVVPFALIGVTVGLLATGQPFGFVALLGAMSLAGMMIKNAIVLLDEIDVELTAGKARYDAVIAAALSRLRPVLLAAGTTVLGVVPLLPDVFWVSMAVTIMFGLAFGTVLTMILVPVLYATMFRLKPES